MIKKYKNKHGRPSIVETIKLTKSKLKFVYGWTNGRVTGHPFYNYNLSNAWYMKSYVGDEIAADGDYLIKKSSGRFYFCTSYTFEKIYEEVE